MTTIGERILSFRDKMGLKQADIFRSAGIKQQTLSSVESGTEPKAGIIAALLAAYPNLNPDWLLTGKGEMLRDGKNLTPIEAPNRTETPARTTPLYKEEETELMREVKASRERAWQEAERAREEAAYWRDLYLGTTDSPLAADGTGGKFVGSHDAAPLIYSYVHNRIGFKTAAVIEQEMQEAQSRATVGVAMWVEVDAGLTTEQEVEAA